MKYFIIFFVWLNGFAMAERDYALAIDLLIPAYPNQGLKQGPVHARRYAYFENNPPYHALFLEKMVYKGKEYTKICVLSFPELCFQEDTGNKVVMWVFPDKVLSAWTIIPNLFQENTVAIKGLKHGGYMCKVTKDLKLVKTSDVIAKDCSFKFVYRQERFNLSASSNNTVEIGGNLTVKARHIYNGKNQFNEIFPMVQTPSGDVHLRKQLFITNVEELGGVVNREITQHNTTKHYYAIKHFGEHTDEMEIQYKMGDFGIDDDAKVMVVMVNSADEFIQIKAIVINFTRSSDPQCDLINETALNHVNGETSVLELMFESPGCNKDVHELKIFIRSEIFIKITSMKEHYSECLQHDSRKMLTDEHGSNYVVFYFRRYYIGSKICIKVTHIARNIASFPTFKPTKIMIDLAHQNVTTSTRDIVNNKIIKEVTLSDTGEGGFKIYHTASRLFIYETQNMTGEQTPLMLGLNSTKFRLIGNMIRSEENKILIEEGDYVKTRQYSHNQSLVYLINKKLWKANSNKKLKPEEQSLNTKLIFDKESEQIFRKEKASFGLLTGVPLQKEDEHIEKEAISLLVSKRHIISVHGHEKRKPSPYVIKSSGKVQVFHTAMSKISGCVYENLQVKYCTGEDRNGNKIKFINGYPIIISNDVYSKTLNHESFNESQHCGLRNDSEIDLLSNNKWKIKDLNEPSPRFKNCFEIKKYCPSSKSGWYIVKPKIHAHNVYCDMENEKGGWMLVVNHTSYDLEERNVSFTSNLSMFLQLANAFPNTDGLQLMLKEFSFSEMRFYCSTINPVETMHLTTSKNSVGIEALKSIVKGERVSSPFSYHLFDDNNSPYLYKYDSWDKKEWGSTPNLDPMYSGLIQTILNGSKQIIYGISQQSYCGSSSGYEYGSWKIYVR